MPTLKIDKLHCTKKTDDSGSNDETYLDLKTDGLVGKLPEDRKYWEMSTGDTQSINRTYDFRGEFFVKCMENDTGSNDTIGEFTFVAGTTPPSSPLYWTGHDSQYQFYFTYTA
ncbi:MAG TPA: hypothetical protein VN851_02100 [Thermoanaerobaculia bacterium]|nr:hypothetical protein [Thermoanaerobaculia bacterium]